jgi:hypothetical protein
MVIVTGTPAIALTNSGGITIAPGATTGNSSTLSASPHDGFTGAVNFSCAVTSTPAAAKDPITCAVSPSSATISGATAATATMTVSSTAATATAAAAIPLRAIGGTALAGMLFFLVPSIRRRQLRGFLSLIALIALGGMVACGGSSSSSGTPPSTSTGTTAGTYVVTVTATPAGASAQTVTVNVTVN